MMIYILGYPSSKILILKNIRDIKQTDMQEESYRKTIEAQNA